MIRVNWKELPRIILITIEGSLSGDSVEIAEQECTEALSTNAPVILLLKNILEIDANGRQFLARMVMKKVQLRAVGIYSRYVARVVQRKTKYNGSDEIAAAWP